MQITKNTKLKRVGIGIVLAAAIPAAGLWYVVNDLPDALTRGRAQPAGVLLDNVRLVSMVRDAPDAEDARAVLVMGDRIVEIGAAGEVRAPR
ncbi:hypothetical protein [Luteimonas sp. 9C]|uniref:hypothetical protein n=1 Tax=Luteimonas sp. 9C TaxID=2653148 RepID=UPI00135B094B|nr:hypothetical protein [Luteimonas sp. 9C]